MGPTKGIKNKNELVYRSLLQKNRDIVHGAFVLDETGDSTNATSFSQNQNEKILKVS